MLPLHSVYPDNVTSFPVDGAGDENLKPIKYEKTHLGYISILHKPITTAQYQFLSNHSYSYIHVHVGANGITLLPTVNKSSDRKKLPLMKHFEPIKSRPSWHIE